ncbi:hypothetical protein AAEU32_13555 [Pseudoalteromonas sp. SSDWG2]|uniref:hypothetical protein n=1 Tax=Pseudoalteromonas sp. SSDWG2 TaxID=3139391 RepID=UPI003BA91217
MTLSRLMGISALLVVPCLANASNCGELEGSWQFVRGEYYTKQGKTVANAPLISSVKVIASGYFNYVTQRQGQFHYAAGGRCAIEDDKFVEYVDYGNIPSLLNKRLAFDYALKDNQWHHRLYQDGVLVEYEVWRKLH